MPCSKPGYISRLPDPWPDDPSPRAVTVLGSTGSIGMNALRVIEAHPARFRVVGLAGGRNATRLAEQAARWRPPHLGVLDEATADALRALLPAGYAPVVHVGAQGFIDMAQLEESRLVLSAQVGAAGLPCTLAAARSGKLIALANKESLVLGGHLVRRACQESGAVLLPVDSEHNAVFQALAGHGLRQIRRILLTASGGPFRGRDQAFLERVTPAMALRHPNWSMGAKITVDSATLMNKGLEVIEAHHLFGLPLERIDVVVHPQSIVHSLVEYCDGSMLAHLGPPDMRIPIAYCLGYPNRLDEEMPALDLLTAGDLTFEPPDLPLFPCLELAREALRRGPGHTAALNAANEAAVELFLAGAIGFTDIPRLIGLCLEAHEVRSGERAPDTLEEALDMDRLARLDAARLARTCSRRAGLNRKPLPQGSATDT